MIQHARWQPRSGRRIGQKGSKERHIGLRHIGLAVGTAIMLAGCGGGSSIGSSSGGSPSISDRFSQLFGSDTSSNSNAQLVGTPPGQTPGQAGGQALTPSAKAIQENCPSVSIREGASTLPVGLPGKEASGSDLRYQVTITRTARDCTLVGGQVMARIGIQGRVIVGPAGAPATVDVPLRMAVVQEGVQSKTIFSKLYRTTVNVDGQENVPFSIVGEDIAYPVPAPDAADAYIFYIGFDPVGAKTPPAHAKKGRKH